LLDPDAFDLEGQNPDEIYEGLQDFYNKAMVGLGGDTYQQRDGVPSKVAQYEFYKGNVAGSPENEQIWD